MKGMMYSKFIVLCSVCAGKYSELALKKCSSVLNYIILF